MSCPSWKELTTRDEPRETTAWSEALEHFDSNCSDCRRSALAADPTLVFRRLPSLEMSAAREASEVDAMVKAVAAMRTASRVEAFERRSRAGGWKRWAAAAVLVGASLSIPADKRVEPTEPAFRGAALMPSVIATELPTLEQVNLPDARVYHMNGKGVAVVMVYDKSFEKLDV